MKKILRKTMLFVITTLFFAFCGAAVAFASTVSRPVLLPIPQAAQGICSVGGDLIYEVLDADYRLHFYRYHPNTQKSIVLGSVESAARWSGDYSLLSGRYLLTCVSIDKRVTTDTKIKADAEETMRLICVDLKNNTTTELARFKSITDLISLEAIDENTVLLYGRLKQPAGIATSYVDTFNIKTKQWGPSIAIEQQRIGAAACDNDMIYVISESVGEGWPVDWDETQKPVYTLSTYGLSGKVTSRKTLDLNSLFPREEGSGAYYKSFRKMSVSGNYIKLDDFGSASALFILKDETMVPIYAGSRLTCWDTVGKAFKADQVYFHTFDGEDYRFSKETGVLTALPKSGENASAVISKFWDGKSDFAFSVSTVGNTSQQQYTITPIPK